MGCSICANLCSRSAAMVTAPSRDGAERVARANLQANELSSASLEPSHTSRAPWDIRRALRVFPFLGWMRLACCGLYADAVHFYSHVMYAHPARAGPIALLRRGANAVRASSRGARAQRDLKRRGGGARMQAVHVVVRKAVRAHSDHTFTQAQTGRQTGRGTQAGRWAGRQNRVGSTGARRRAHVTLAGRGTRKAQRAGHLKRGYCRMRHSHL